MDSDEDDAFSFSLADFNQWFKDSTEIFKEIETVREAKKEMLVDARKELNEKEMSVYAKDYERILKWKRKEKNC